MKASWVSEFIPAPEGLSRCDTSLKGATLPPSRGVQLGLLGGFSLQGLPAAGRLNLPHQAQRLLAVLAIAGITSRAWVAGTLWPETTEDRAHSSLRTAIWQVTRSSSTILCTQGTELGLADDIQVDIRALRQAAQAALNDGIPSQGQVEMLRGAPDLLLGWYDDWVHFERESLTQLRLHALERLSAQRLTHGRYADALALALAAVATEPLRDSAHRLVVQCHLREGNAVHALRHFDGYRDLLHRELGIPPSPQMQQLIGPLRSTHSPRTKPPIPGPALQQPRF
jgi:DNA-binding SARP family transcriptional activator